MSAVEGAMKLSTKLAIVATLLAIVPTLHMEKLETGVSIIVLAWALKFILGSLIDKKAETKE